MKVMERTENGTVTHVTMTEGLREINHAMMDGKRHVRTMSSTNSGGYAIEYKDGRSVTFRRVDVDDSVMEPKPEPTDEPCEWHGTASNGSNLHRFTDDNRARCNRGIWANPTPPVGGKGPWGVFKRTRSEILASQYAHLYTFCSRCEAK